MNALDKGLNTPLHVAVRCDQENSVMVLMENGADPTLLNDDEMAPIHLAIDVNATKALSVWTTIL